MAVKNYRDLIVWQKAMDLVLEVYRITEAFPANEQFGLTSQLRRATVSVPSNIAEGEGRQNPGDFKRFLAIAHGSLREVETQLLIANRLKLIGDADLEPTLDNAAEIGRMIQGLTRSLR